MDLEQKISKYFPKDWKQQVHKVSDWPWTRGRPCMCLVQGHAGPPARLPAVPQSCRWWSRWGG